MEETESEPEYGMERMNAMRVTPVMPDEELFMSTPEDEDIVEVSSDGESEHPEEDDEEDDAEEGEDVAEESDEDSDDDQADIEGLIDDEEQPDSSGVEGESDHPGLEEESVEQQMQPHEEEEEEDELRWTSEPAHKKQRKENVHVPDVEEDKRPVAEVMKGVRMTQLWRVSQEWTMQAPYGLEPELDRRALAAAIKSAAQSGAALLLEEVKVDREKPHHKGLYSITNFVVNGGSGRVAALAAGEWRVAASALAKRVWEVMVGAEELNKAQGKSFLARSNEDMQGVTAGEQLSFIRRVAKDVVYDIMEKITYATQQNASAVNALLKGASQEYEHDWGDGLIMRTMESFRSQTAEDDDREELNAQLYMLQDTKNYITRVVAVTRYLYSTLTTGSAPGDMKHGVTDEDKDTVMEGKLFYSKPDWKRCVGLQGEWRIPIYRTQANGDYLPEWKDWATTGEDPLAQLQQRAAVAGVITASRGGKR
jgi:hypothetical protein